jgi:hypothetical protein
MTVVCMSVNATIYHGYCGYDDDTEGKYPEDAEWFFDSATGCLTIKLVHWNGNTEINPYSDDYPQAPWWMYYEDVKSVVVGEGITNLPGWAFAMMDKCTSVTLPSTLTVIGKAALEECAFTSINLPEGLETIGDYSLMSGAFSTVTIPSTVTYIGEVAFQDNDNLTTVTCLNPDPNTITFFPDAFQNCDNLTAIYVPAGSVEDYITEWSDYSGIIQPIAATTTTFTYQATAKVDAFDTFANFNGATGVESHGFTGGTGTVVYNGTVTSIGSYALAVPGLTSVTIPNSVVWIGEGAFDWAENLEELIIPNSVISIGNMAIEATNISSLTIPSSVKYIGDMAFEGSAALVDLSLNSGLVAIGAMAFDDCDALTSLSIPGSVEIIGTAAFSECSNLATVTLGKGVTVLDQSCFGDCAALTTINIPSTVTTITDAFPGSNNMETIYCFADPSISWTVGVIDNFKTDGSTKCYVADASAWSGSTLNLTFDDSSKPLEGTVVENDCWTSFYDATNSYEVDANTTVYKANLDGTTLTTTPIGGNQIITAGNAVILKSTGIPVLTTTATESTGNFSGNSLQGSDGSVVSDGSAYALGYKNSIFAFFKVKSGSTIPAGKAYVIKSGSAPSYLEIVINDDSGVTGISSTLNNKEEIKDNAVYNLAGQRVENPTKGLYIVNGKKVIIK